MLYRDIRKVGYIRYNTRKYENFLGKLLNFVRKIFVKVVIENVENGIIILVPFSRNSSNKIINRIIIRQIKKYIKHNDINYIVCEHELENIVEKSCNINILNGKYLMKYIIYEILDNIFIMKKENINLENIHIFVNEYSKNNINIIKMLATKCKTVNIITENLRYYKRLEESLYNEGILITVSNNKRKSARNAKIIINMDFVKETFEQYNINRNSIIINLTDEKVFFKNSFRGVLVNDFEITLDSDLKCFCDEFYGRINEKLLLESFILSEKYDYFCNCDGNCMGKNQYEYYAKISQLIGIRGPIQKCEFCKS